MEHVLFNWKQWAWIFKIKNPLFSKLACWPHAMTKSEFTTSLFIKRILASKALLVD